MDQQDYQSLLGWYRSNSVNLNPSLELRNDPVTQLSFFATWDLPKDSVAIEVPTEICLTPQTSKEAILSTFPEESRFDTLDLSPHDWVVFYLYLTKVLDEVVVKLCLQDDPSHPLRKHSLYVRSIPKVILTPLHYRFSELQLLRGTPLFGATVERLSKTRASFENVSFHLEAHLLNDQGHLSTVRDPLTLGLLQSLNLLGETVGPRRDRGSTDGYDFSTSPSLEIWRWAESAYGSRAFPPRLIGLPEDQVSSDPSEAILVGPVLIPALDTFNHARGKPVTWSYQPGEDSPSTRKPRKPKGSVVLTLHHPTPKGEQVFNNYGAKSNEEFLGSYGFVLKEGLDDALTLKLATEDGDGTVEGSDWGRSHYWRKDSIKAPDGLLKEIRQRLNSSAHQDRQEEEEGRGLEPDSSSSEKRELKSLYEEANVYETLEVLLLNKRKAFRKSEAAGSDHVPVASGAVVERHVSDEEGRRTEVRDPEAPVREEVRSMITVYRQGQATILDNAVSWVRSQLESIADRLDELEGSQEE
ncbi:SET domain-containing protein [Violaceomyces palustris]|uniref:SET domain-containing protein n=1 Tax=Violaceomyces palustris TaxID=1673888 RepID=A0ACD0P020_9BASI|nr:SET domain-containing protein [Violaceomyces palustris]